MALPLGKIWLRRNEATGGGCHGRAFTVLLCEENKQRTDGKGKLRAKYEVENKGLGDLNRLIYEWTKR
jgi:hypothetical protein